MCQGVDRENISELHACSANWTISARLVDPQLNATHKAMVFGGLRAGVCALKPCMQVN